MESQQKEFNKNNNISILVIPVLIIRAILWFPAQILCYFLLRMEVEGKENLKVLKTGRVIFASNHSSEIDPYAFQYTLSFASKFVPLYFVSLTKEYYTFKRFGIRSFYYGGLFFRMMGAYPVYKGMKDYSKAFVHHIKILKQNHSVLIFPEGSIKNNNITKTKPGYIYLAKKTNAVIVPVKIKGTDNLTYKDIFLRKRKMTITFGKPIQPFEIQCEVKEKKSEEMQNEAMRIMNIIKTI